MLRISANRTNTSKPSYNSNKAINLNIHCKSSLAPLTHDCISFKKSTQKVKKSDFSGVNAAIVDKFRVNISGFKTVDDLDIWAKKRIFEEFQKKDLKGRHEDTQTHRKEILDEWIDYVANKNSSYSPATQFLIFNAITKDLKDNNDRIPPIFNQAVLDETILALSESLTENPKMDFDLNKIYQANLSNLCIETSDSDNTESDTKWIHIPSKENEPEKFSENVDKLKTLSHKNWCTKTYNAGPYLSNGDFHLYLDKGKPKVGIRIADNKIAEIQGELNNSRIPQLYLDVVKEYINTNNFALSERACEELTTAEKVKKELAVIKKDFQESINNNDAETIFNYFGIKTKKDSDGKLIISEYEAPSKDYSFEDLGIDTQRLLENVKTIEGNADFCCSKIKNLKNLEYIGGNATFSCSDIKFLNNLEYIGGNVIINKTKIENLDKLKTVIGDIQIENPVFTSIPQLERAGNLSIHSINKNLSLPSLTQIDRTCNINGCKKLIDFRNLKTIGKSLRIRNLEENNLNMQSLKTIGKDLYIQNTSPDFPKLNSIGGKLYINNASFINIPELKKINGDCIIIDSSHDTKSAFNEVKIKGKTLNNKNILDRVFMRIIGYC